MALPDTCTHTCAHKHGPKLMHLALVKAQLKTDWIQKRSPTSYAYTEHFKRNGIALCERALGFTGIPGCPLTILFQKLNVVIFNNP